jgi:hypothetical protein
MSGSEAPADLVASNGDALDLYEFAEKVLDRMAPLVEVGVERHGSGPLSRVFLQTSHTVIAKGLIGDQSAQCDSLFTFPKTLEGRQGLPVYAIQRTVSLQRRLSNTTSPEVDRLTKALRFHLRRLGVRKPKSIHPELGSQLKLPVPSDSSKDREAGSNTMVQ